MIFFNVENFILATMTFLIFMFYDAVTTTKNKNPDLTYDLTTGYPRGCTQTGGVDFF